MGGFVFFSLTCIMALGMGWIFWRGFQTMRASLLFEAELHVHWRKIYPQRKEWDYLWRWRNWRKIIGAEMLMRYPQLDDALSQHEQQSSRYGRELLCFILISPLVMGLVFVVGVFIEMTAR